MKILGAILAGGKSSRFGGDKPAAMLNGRPLIEHSADALAAVCDDLIVVGYNWNDMKMVADRPAPDMGPLGGLCGALCHGRDAGFDIVISAGCDMMPVLLPPLPRRANDMDHAVYIEDHFLAGIWPVALAGSLEKYLANNSDHSMRGWIRACGAAPVAAAEPFHNLNSAEDIAQYQALLDAQKLKE